MVKAGQLYDPGRRTSLREHRGADLRMPVTPGDGPPQLQPGAGGCQPIVGTKPPCDHVGHAVARPLRPFANIVEQSSDNQIRVVVASLQEPPGGSRRMSLVSWRLGHERRP